MRGGHTTAEALTLEALNRLIGRLVTVADTQNVWVTAELSDVAVRGGHCYLELLQKDASTGRQIAKARGVIWANLYPYIAGSFLAATGQQFGSGIKVMLRVSVSYHAVFGLSLVISEVNPDYTLGDLMRRRREILARLEKEGILNDNKALQWAPVPQRLAVISAPGAAGYGDFINQLFNNKSHLHFSIRLFEATMQGERAPASIIGALERIMEEVDNWDGVVIIRGGGATSDLAAFEDYNLAASVAQFPLPVIIGIGHERDVTVLDYVANMRVKTPTAAAEWLIGAGEAALNHLHTLGVEILRSVSDKINGYLHKLAYLEGLLPLAPHARVDRAMEKLRLLSTNINATAAARLTKETSRCDNLAQSIRQSAELCLLRSRERLNGFSALITVLSPAATLARGYSITRCNGKSVRSVSEISPGEMIETILSDGTLISIVKD